MINSDFILYMMKYFQSTLLHLGRQNRFSRISRMLGPRRDGNHRDNIIPIRNKYRHVGLTFDSIGASVSHLDAFGRKRGQRGGYYGRASELYALPHVCRINLFQPRFRPPYDYAGTALASSDGGLSD